MASNAVNGASSGTETAYFANGCFCEKMILTMGRKFTYYTGGTEHMFRKQFGNLKSVSVGYIGGNKKSPSYREVCSGTTGHAEAIKVIFDPSQVSYAELVEFHYRMHDATQTNRQGPDVGTQYRSAIFTTSASQTETAEKVTAEVQEQHYKGRKIATIIEEAGQWWEAEDYHQQYLHHNKYGYECPSHRLYWDGDAELFVLVSVKHVASHFDTSSLKPLCVSLLPRVPVNPRTAADTSQKLQKLCQILRNLPTNLLSGPLLDYAFFPLSQLLRINSLDNLASFESVLEHCMHAVALLIRPWRIALPGIKRDLIQQIWLICILILGGPLENSRLEHGKGKRKGITWSEETLHSTLDVLTALIEPLPLKELSHHEPHHLPLSILAHTLTSLLDLVETSRDMALRIDALSTLGHLNTQYLRSQHNGDATVLVQFFPGLVSAMAKVLAPSQKPVSSAAKPISSDLAVHALNTLRSVVSAVFSSSSCRDILDRRKSAATKIERLEDLAKLQTEMQVTTPDSAEPIFQREEWIQSTASQLHLAILSFSTAMRDHHSSETRCAYALLAGTLCIECAETVQASTFQLALADLAILSCDDQPEVGALADRQLAGIGDAAGQLYDLLKDMLLAIPQIILRYGDDESRMRTAAALLRGSASALSDPGPYLGALARTFDHWSTRLLSVLEYAAFDAQLGSSGHPESSTIRAWIAPPRATMRIESESAGSDLEWPYLPFLRIASARSSTSLRQALVALGRLSSDESRQEALNLAQRYLAMAVHGLIGKHRASAWWLLDTALEALVPRSGLIRPSIAQRKVARSTVQAFVDLADEDLREDIGSEKCAEPAEETSMVPIERQKGSNEVASRLASFAGTGSTEHIEYARKRAIESTRTVLLCNSLRSLATSSAILSLDFRSELIAALYPILSYLGPMSHPVLQSYAEVALARVAEHSGYASIRNLVLDNVDYAVNSVSQRLRLPRLDPQAPLVLVTMINLAGKEIVPLVQDVVEDIFDALDDFHQYDALCAGLLAVLDALVRATAEDVAPARQCDAASTGHPQQPDPENDLLFFEKWLEEHRGQVNRPRENFGPPPHRSWASEVLDDVDAHEAEAGADATAKSIEEETPPNRAQAVCIAMFEKALLFISHDSAFLRARVLSLIASGVPTMATRKGDLLPVIHKAWPYVLVRLSDSENPAVVAEAAALIETLGRVAGEFMSRKILEDAWPRFRTLLGKMAERQKSSAIRDRFSSAQRIQMAIIGAMRHVCGGVPLQDELAWELARDMRMFLRRETDEHIKQEAASLYVELRRWHPEIVWLSLVGGIGTEILPPFLRADGLLDADLVAHLV